MDEYRFDDLHGLFIEDATAATPGGTAQGRNAVIAQATRNHENYDHLHHLITNVLVDLDGDRAAVRANLVATFVRDAGRPEFQLGAVYRLQSQRTRQGWQLASIEVNPVWRLAPELVVTPTDARLWVEAGAGVGARQRRQPGPVLAVQRH